METRKELVKTQLQTDLFIWEVHLLHCVLQLLPSVGVEGGGAVSEGVVGGVALSVGVEWGGAVSMGVERGGAVSVGVKGEGQSACIIIHR